MIYLQLDELLAIACEVLELEEDVERFPGQATERSPDGPTPSEPASPSPESEPGGPSL